MISIFDFPDYKSYLRALAKTKGARSGFKSSLAKAAGCNLTYISNVLGGTSHLSLEQAEKMNSLLAHTPDEAHYFLLLIQKDRAGTESLRRYFQNELKKVLEKRLNVRSRLGFEAQLKESDRNKYYSAWYFAAIHVALSVPALRTPQALARYFRLPLKTVAGALDFLVHTGLALKSGAELKIGPSIIHLGNDAEQIAMHHTNWRTQAITRLSGENSDELHYSAAVTISKDDAVIVKNQLLESLKAATQKIAASREEEVFALNFDFFSLRSGEDAF